MSDRTGQHLGNYRLLRQLGKGGFADVYLGEHLYLPRGQVAIKILHTSLSITEQTNFIQEAQTIEQLKHPSIIEILDFGIEQSVPYMVMEYMQQGTLRDKHPKGSIVPLSTVVDYVKQIAGALQHAHDKRIIHRDLKPENILLKGRILKVSDFGIATAAHSTIRLNQQPIPYAGTIPYSAPEQIQGQPRPSSDQYALGIIVYEWLTGTRPFKGTLMEIATQHLTVAPRPLRQLIPVIPAAVEAVVLKALSKDPKQRFASVNEFAEAVEQAYVQTVVLPGTMLYTIKLFASVGAVAWSPDGKRIASHSRSRVFLWNASDGTDRIKYNETHYGDIQAIAWSPDGKRLATAADDEKVIIWDVSTGTKLLNHQHRAGVNSVSWSPDGKRIVSGSRDLYLDKRSKDTLHVWDALTGKLLFYCKDISGDVFFASWSSDGQFILARTEKSLNIWDATTGNHRFTVDGLISSVQFSSDSKFIAFSENCVVKILIRLTTDVYYQILWTFYIDNSDAVTSISWSPDGRFIAVGNNYGRVEIWELATRKRLLTYAGHSADVTSISWSPNGKYIASGSNDRTVQVWNAV